MDSHGPATAFAQADHSSTAAAAAARPAIDVRGVDFCYGTKKSLSNISLEIAPHQVTAFIGPSGCGKSTLLRCFNRMNDMVHGAHVSKGEILVEGVNIYDPRLEVIDLRRRVGMVFQKSNPFPSSIYENIAYGLRIAGGYSKKAIDEAVEQSLTAAALWDETKDRLHESALGMSGGQQQRLCIARAVAVKPDIILMDEPCSALDPIATLRIEELIHQLKESFTIVVVTHNMQQATRCADRTAFFYLGEMIEEGPTTKIFSTPAEKKTEDYISGRFG